MKERPILMTPENAQKCHDGTKTQTRRILDLSKRPGAKYEGYDPRADESKFARCPYGAPGDRLWVRETWQVDAPRDGTWADTQFYGCKGSPLSDIPAQYQRPEYCLFRASWTGTPIIWRPSIYMPRWACRTVLEITEVRVQRLQEITPDDARAEGCDDDMCARGAFEELWESINGAGSWAANPWVWAISFKKGSV